MQLKDKVFLCVFFNPGRCCEAIVLANEGLCDCHAYLLVLIIGHLQVTLTVGNLGGNRTICQQVLIG